MERMFWFVRELWTTTAWRQQGNEETRLRAQKLKKSFITILKILAKFNFQILPSHQLLSQTSIMFWVNQPTLSRYTSLPPNSINMLSLLIESKVRLPQCAPTHSRATKRELLRSQGERDFFLNIVRDVATDLDLKSLSHKTVDNLTVYHNHCYYKIFSYFEPFL